MVVSLWSLKGGVGCSVTAALVALHRARTDPNGAVIVDLRGDQPAVLGCDDPGDVGIGAWLRQGADGPPEGLARLERAVAPRLRLIGRGATGAPEALPGDAALAVLGGLPGSVVVDCGLVLGSGGDVAAARWIAARSERSILVTTACYVALRQASAAPFLPSGVVLVREPGRGRSTHDVERANGAPGVAPRARGPARAPRGAAGLVHVPRPPGPERARGAG